MPTEYNDVDLAYIAGLFDGEGSVSFFWPKATNGKRYGKLYARISQNDRRVLDWVVKTLGFGSVQKHSLRPKAPNFNLHHTYAVSNSSARKFLALIRVHLKVKGDAVDEKLALDAEHCIPKKKSC